MVIVFLENMLICYVSIKVMLHFKYIYGMDYSKRGRCVNSPFPVMVAEHTHAHVHIHSHTCIYLQCIHIHIKVYRLAHTCTCTHARSKFS